MSEAAAAAAAIKPKVTDGIVGFITSKRAIAMVVGVISTLLASWKGIDIDDALRVQAIEGITWIVGIFVGGTSLSDTLGKGKVAEENRAKIAGIIQAGLGIAAAVVSKKDGDESGGDQPS